MEIERCMETLKNLNTLQIDAAQDLAEHLSDLFRKILDINVRIYDNCACEELAAVEFDVDDEGRICMTTHYA